MEIEILEIAHTSMPGGVLKVAMNQTKMLNQLGHKAFLVTGFEIPKAKEFFGDHDFLYEKYNFSPPKFLVDYLGTMFREFFAEVGFIDLPSGFSPDWIICHDLRSVRDGFHLAEKFDCKTAVVMHSENYPPSIAKYALQLLGVEPKKYLKRARDMLSETDLVFALHSDNVNITREKFGVKAEWLPYGYNPLPSPPRSRGDYVLCVARMSLGKKIHKIAEAISVADKKAKVIFAGSSHATTPEVMKKIDETDLKNYSVLLNVSQSTIDRLFRKCRVGVYAHSEMDFMLPACYGAPVVCFAKRYAEDVLESGVHGFIIERSDRKEFPVREYASRVAELLEDRKKAWRMGYKAWKLCSEKYTWKAHTEKIISKLLKEK